MGLEVPKNNWYKADECNPEDKWQPSIHMPKEVVRIFLRVTDVRVEKLQNISIEGIKAEGVDRKNIRGCSCAWKTETCMAEPCANRDSHEYLCWADSFAELWNNTVKKSDLEKYGWNANPWVWVFEFERVNIK